MQRMTVSQLRKTEEGEVELRMPGSFDFGDHGVTVGPVGAVGMLGNLW